MSAGWVILICVGAFAALCAAALYAGMRLACVAPRVTEKTVPAVIRRSSVREYYDEVMQSVAAVRALPFERVSVTSFDGLRLSGRWLPAENAVGTALFFHGWRSIAELDFSAASGFYRSLGLNLLLVDQRAQGQSEGTFMTFGVREHRDVQPWLEWIGKRCPGKPVLLAGLSMGAATVLMAAADPMPDTVRGILADCGFTSPKAIFTKVLRERHLPARLILTPVNWLTRVFAGFDMEECSTLDALRRTKLPVLLIHGEADRFVPCEMSRENFAACASADKTLFTVPGAPHGGSYLVDRAGYEKTVCAFVRRIMGVQQ